MPATRCVDERWNRAGRATQGRAGSECAMPPVLFFKDAWLTAMKEEAQADAQPLADGLLDAHPSTTTINNPNASGLKFLEPIPAL